MDKRISEMASYTALLSNQWFSKGPSIWSCKDGLMVPQTMKVGSQTYSGEELLNFAIDCKRKGDYATSIDIYNALISTSFSEYQVISTGLIRGLFKVLACANEFSTAFTLIATTVADIQMIANTTGKVDPTEYNLLWDYFEGLSSLAKDVVDDGDYSGVMPFCANYSGTPLYRLVGTQEDIYQELSKVRDEMKKHMD